MNFKPGNIIRLIDTYWHGDLNEPRDEIGKLYVIEYSYGEKYGDGTCFGGYSIIDMETGSSSYWWDESCLEFVKDGSVELINQLKIKRNRMEEDQKDLCWIKENFSHSLSVNSILTLFHKIGYKSPFESNDEYNGEYYDLMYEWVYLYPVFDAIFKGNKNQMMKLIDETFTENFKVKYGNNISSFYDEVAAM